MDQGSAPPAPLPTAFGVSDGPFITPRVLDQRAFDELSTTLKGLVGDATSRGQALQAAAIEVKSLSDGLREASKAIQQKLETAVRVLPQLEQRAAAAEAMINATVDRPAIERRLEEAVQRILDAALERLTADAAARLTARADELAREADARLAAAEDQRRAAEQRLAELTEAARAIEPRLIEALAQVTTRLAPLAELTERLIADLDDRLGKVRWEIEATAGPATARLERLCRHSAEIVGDGAAPGSLAGLVERGTHVRDELAAMLARVEGQARSA